MYAPTVKLTSAAAACLFFAQTAWSFNLGLGAQPAQPTLTTGQHFEMNVTYALSDYKPTDDRIAIVDVAITCPETLVPVDMTPLGQGEVLELADESSFFVFEILPVTSWNMVAKKDIRDTLPAQCTVHFEVSHLSSDAKTPVTEKLEVPLSIVAGDTAPKEALTHSLAVGEQADIATLNLDLDDSPVGASTQSSSTGTEAKPSGAANNRAWIKWIGASALVAGVMLLL
ncbi:hypothetical protein HK102_001130 [Quaeritorhiza haematococci]|nr:hypothetical protein HK102_001130 [Quaeritorhiza haematococci]